MCCFFVSRSLGKRARGLSVVYAVTSGECGENDVSLGVLSVHYCVYLFGIFSGRIDYYLFSDEDYNLVSPFVLEREMASWDRCWFISDDIFFEPN